MKNHTNTIMKIVTFVLLFTTVPYCLSKLLYLVYDNFPENGIDMFSSVVFLLLYLFKAKIQNLLKIKNKLFYILSFMGVYFFIVNLVLVVLNCLFYSSL